MNHNVLENPVNARTEPNWRVLVAPYRTPSLNRSLWQLANSVIPFFFLLTLMYMSLSYSYWLTLALAPLTAGFQLRLFIIFHDCGHQSFFKSQRANYIIGSICGFFCFTPYHHWRHSHALHHATVGNLGRRIEGELMPMSFKKYTQNNGDVLTLTLQEYQQLSAPQKLVYRLYRSPLVLFMVLPLFLFLVLHRFATPTVAKRERDSVLWTNLALLVMVLVVGLLIGFGPLFMILMPVLCLSATAGVWLFYIQHQFEASYWQQEKDWSFVTASLKGSSYYKLPRVLQWFTGNIGFHHIHHLSPRIPNYFLEKCHGENSLFQQSNTITIIPSMKSVLLRLWDEEQQRMIGFGSSRIKAANKGE